MHHEKRDFPFSEWKEKASSKQIVAKGEKAELWILRNAGKSDEGTLLVAN